MALKVNSASALDRRVMIHCILQSSRCVGSSGRKKERAPMPQEMSNTSIKVFFGTSRHNFCLGGYGSPSPPPPPPAPPPIASLKQSRIKRKREFSIHVSFPYLFLHFWNPCLRKHHNNKMKIWALVVTVSILSFAHVQFVPCLPCARSDMLPMLVAFYCWNSPSKYVKP